MRPPFIVIISPAPVAAVVCRREIAGTGRLLSLLFAALLNAGFHPIDMANSIARPEGATTAYLNKVAKSDLFVNLNPFGSRRAT